MEQLDQTNGTRVADLSKAEAADKRANETAQQQIAKVTALETSMNAKTKQIQAQVNKVNSSTMTQAMAVFNQTGSYPNITIPGGSSVGAKALDAALTRRGDPYIWGAAGPSEFDCSGLVMWAYEQEGIQLTTSPATSGPRASTSRVTSSSRVTWCSSTPTSATSACTSATA